ncbi:MAG: AI-2E family transporter [Gammaproteobacteria bacterium]|nr:MAG: AI-2E family transporter [Gammaproteobacteria bacterium]
MFKLVSGWYKQYFSDQEAVILILLLLVGFTVILTMGKFLAPVFTAIVLAYLLQGVINLLQGKGVPKAGAIGIAYTLFLGLLGGFIFGLVPLTVSQFDRFLEEQLPRVIVMGNDLMKVLPEQYPDLVSQERIDEITTMASSSLTDAVETVVSFSVTGLPVIFGLLIFLVLVPLLVFFFLKDKDEMTLWLLSFLPDERPFINTVLGEMNVQISNYVRGKAIEILIVGGVTYIALAVMGVQYAALLGLLVGLSVVIPYIGATIVTIPVALVAYFQFGWGSEFAWVMIIYALIQAVDGNVLVPLLFSEAVNLHPVAIITAVLVFGGLWGVWGVFFAIPLATLLKAMMTSWPKSETLPDQADWLDKID